MAIFDDGKEPGALRTIGEVSAATGVKSHVLRYWEAQFPMLKPLTRSGGRRYYRPEDIKLVREIDRLVNREGYTLKGAKAALRGANGTRMMGGDDAAAQTTAELPQPAPAVDAELGSRLKAIRDDLRRALAA